MSTCPVCDGATSTPIYAGLLRCPACTHVWADAALDWADLSTLYQRSYFFGDEYLNYVADRRVLEKNFGKRLATLRRFLDSRHQRLFEVGCAYGFFLNLSRGSFDSVQGIDISPDAIAFATREFGVDAICGDLLTADLANRQFDVACMWDTIEHLAKPRPYLERLASAMPAGALVAMTTGDIGSLIARIQGRRWRLIHPPTHLHYFTQSSLTTLLERAGFRVRHLERCGFSRSVRSMLHNLLALRWHSPRLADTLSRLVPPRLDLYLNLYDIMFVVAERR